MVNPSRAPRRRAPAVEVLEPRVLYAADPAGLSAGWGEPSPGDDAGGPWVGWTAPGGTTTDAHRPAGVEPGSDPLASGAAERAGGARELAVVDLGIPDAERLLAELAAQRDAGRPIDLLRIDGEADGVRRIGDALDGTVAYAAVHLFGHGREGAITLGATTLDSALLFGRADEVARWSAGLAAGADLLLWGCDSGAGERGARLLDGLVALTGADVAASTDATGGLAAGGDWTLEAGRGTVRADAPLGAGLRADFGGVLAAPMGVEVGVTEVQVNQAIDDPQSLPREGGGRQVATSATAGVTAVVWHDGDGDDAWVRRFDATGTPLGAAQQVAPSGTGWDSAAVAMAADGRFVVVGIRQGSDQVWARRYDVSGNPDGAAFRVDSGSMGASQPSVAMNASGAFVIAWGRDAGSVDGLDVVAQRFDAAGAAVGGILQVAATRSGDQSAPAVALRDDGSFAVAYSGPHGGEPAIFIRQFSTSGSPVLGSEQKLAALGASDPPRGVDIAVDGSGRYLVVWDVPGGSAPGIYGRIATSAGDLPIPVRRLDDLAGDSSALRPSVTALAPGRFVVAWESDANLDGDGRAVHLRTFDTNAIAVGPSQRLNEHTGGDQESPSIAARGGTVYAAWSGASANDDDGVVLRDLPIAVPGIDRVVVGTATGEAGAPVAHVDLRLTSAPTAAVQIALAVSDPLEGRLSTSVLNFGPGNWSTAQRVTVQGVDDRVVDGSRPFTVTFAVTSTDPGYAGLTIAPINYTNADDDTRNEVVVNTLADVSDGDVSSLAALVRTPGADGGISLREALLAANATANGSGGVDRIIFDLPGAGARTIVLGSALPVITDAVEIDGTADPDHLAGGGPVVVLQPATASAAFNGLELGPTVSGATIRGLAIGGMERGIVVRGSGNLIESNFVGTDATGQLDVGNRWDGVLIDGGSSNVVRGNLLAGNGESGVELRGDASGNRVEDNRLGTNAAGTAALGNDRNGVYLRDADDNVVRNNLIGGNGRSGVRLEGSGSRGNQVVGNVIGTSHDGTVALPNGQAGVLILSGASDNLIGGPGAADGNRIVGNAQAGVRVVGGGGRLSLGNAIVGNTIDGHELGIDLGDTFTTPIAVTPNDAGDADAGGNGAQNFPVLTSVVASGPGALTVGGTLGSAASTRYRIDVYADPTPNATGHGEAATWLGQFVVITDAAGDASFSQTLTPATVPAVGTAITATATRLATGDVLRDTSEFGPNRALAAPMVFTNLPDRSVAENTLAVATLRVTPSGLPAPAPTYAIVADAATDGALFEIVGGDQLRFRTAPDFEAPADGDGDNRYTVRVTATDGPYVTALTMTVRVTDAATGLVPATGAVPASPPAAGSQRTTETGGRAVAVLPDGGAVVVWTDTAQGTAQVWARRLDPLGDPIGTAWRVDPGTGPASQPAVAVDATGRIAIAWAENEAGAGDVRLRVWQPDLATADPIDLVPAGAVLTVNTDAAGRQAEPAIAADPSGGWVVTWTQGDATDSERSVFLRRLPADDTPAAAPVRVSNPDNIAARAHSAVGVAGDGTIVVAYAFDGGGSDTWGVFVRVFDQDGTARTGWIEVDPQPGGPQTQPELSVAPDGRFVVAWTDLPVEATPTNGEGVRARIFDRNGVPLTGEIAMDQVGVGAQHAPTVAMLADGGFVAAWQSFGQDAAGTEGIVIRRFGATGANLTSERVATPHVAGDQIRPSLAVRGDRVVLAWSGATAADADGVSLRSFNVVDPGFAVVPVVPGPAGLALAEAGGSVAFDLVATAEPGAPLTVRVALPPIVAGRVSLSAGEFTFDRSTWNQPQRLVVTSVPDGLTDGELVLRLTATPMSTDPAFAALAPIARDLVRADDDLRNRIVVDTLGDVVDGDVRSLAQLAASRGADERVSLREALLAANATANAAGGPDEILFDLPGVGAQTILIGEALPAITDAVLIDGASDPEFAGSPVVTLAPVSPGPGFAGLTLAPGSDGSTLRGLAITDFGGDGVRVGSDGNTIESNHLGVDAGGTGAAGNLGAGVAIVGDASVNRVRDNVIGANAGGGVRIDGTGADGNRVQANHIGVSRDGTVALGNAGAGVTIAGGASGNQIGGPSAGDGNRIVGNGARGVHVVGDASTSDNAIVRNAIDGHGLGIDLAAGFEPTPSATVDGSQGSDGGNRLQVAPVLVGARPGPDGTSVRVEVSLTAAAETVYRIDFYADAEPSTTGFGEGPVWLAAQQVTTNASGLSAWTQTLPVALQYRTGISATATRSDAYGTVLGDTSEFSRSAPVNTSPVQTGATLWTLPEGRTAVGVLSGVDPDSGTDGLRWSIVPGGDGAAFTIDAVTGALAFAVPPDFEQPIDQDGDGLYRLRVRLQDPLGGVTERDHEVRVTDRNEAPVVSMPTQVAGREDTPLRFDATTGSALSVTDPDTTAAPLRVSLSVDRGRLTLAGVEGLTFERGDGTGDSTLRFTGTPEHIAAALASVLYQPDADDDGTVTLRLSARDAGAAGLANVAQLEIVLEAVNDAPVFAPDETDPLSVRSGRSLRLGQSALQADDVDHRPEAIVYTVVQAPASGELRVGRTPLAVGGQFTQADVDAGRLTFVAGAPGLHALAFEVVDGGNASAGPVTLRIKVDGFGGTGAAAPPAPAASLPTATETARADAAAATDAAPARDAGSADGGGTQRAAPGPAAVTGGGGAARSASAAHGSGELGGGPLALGGRSEEFVGPGVRADRSPGVLRYSAEPPAFRFGDTADFRARSIAVRVEPGAALEPVSRAAPIAASGSTAEPTRPWSPVAALRQADFREALSRVREDAATSFEVRGALVASTAAITTSLSIGYVVWLLRGGVLLTSLLASMPAWRSIDPLPVLARTDARGRDADGEDDSLRGLLARAAEREARVAEAARAEADAVPAGASA